MSEDAAFLAALDANPADDTTRLVYADWLDDRGEADRATYLRRVVDLTVLAPGSEAYTAAAGELVMTSRGLDPDWRVAAGGRFDLVLVSFKPHRKIDAIRGIRWLTGLGLSEAKALAESVPVSLFSWQTFEESLPRLLRFLESQTSDCPPDECPAAMIRSTLLPALVHAPAYDIVLSDVDAEAGGGWDNMSSAHRLVAIWFKIDDSEARQLLEDLPITLASGVRARDVADRVREALTCLNVYRAIPRGGIQVIPHVSRG